MGIRCADHVTPLYPQKLAITWPTGGGRSVGIVRSRTKATECIYIYVEFSLWVKKIIGYKVIQKQRRPFLEFASKYLSHFVLNRRVQLSWAGGMYYWNRMTLEIAHLRVF